MMSSARLRPVPFRCPPTLALAPFGFLLGSAGGTNEASVHHGGTAAIRIASLRFSSSTSTL
eukprot:4723463-Amphidinium_carterae.1